MSKGTSKGGMIEDDAAIQACFNYICTSLSKIDAGYSQYLAVLNGISQQAVTRGDTADAIKRFIQSATRLQGAYGSLKAEAQAACRGFVSEVSAADRVSI